MNIEIMRNTLYKAYLEDFYKFCEVILLVSWEPSLLSKTFACFAYEISELETWWSNIRDNVWSPCIWGRQEGCEYNNKQVGPERFCFEFLWTLIVQAGLFLSNFQNYWLLIYFFILSLSVLEQSWQEMTERSFIPILDCCKSLLNLYIVYWFVHYFDSIWSNILFADRYPYGHEELAICEDIDQVNIFTSVSLYFNWLFVGTISIPFLFHFFLN